MEAKGIAALALVLVAGGVAAAAGEFYRDFRGGVFNHVAFQMVGPGAGRFVEAGPDGLRIRSLDGANHEPTGVTLRSSVKGDFEITASFVIRTVDRPATGYRMGVGLYLAAFLDLRIKAEDLPAEMPDAPPPAPAKVADPARVVPEAAQAPDAIDPLGPAPDRPVALGRWLLLGRRRG